MKKLLLLMMPLLVMALSGVALSEEEGPAADGQVRWGKVIYQTYCSVCHGPAGAGDGTSAHALIPGPPDFTSPDVQQSLTDEQMLYSILEGDPGTQMEGWKDRLTIDDVYAVIAYIRSLGK